MTTSRLGATTAGTIWRSTMLVLLAGWLQLGHAAQPNGHVSARDGRLTATFVSMPLGEAVAATASAAGLHVEWLGEIGDEPVTLTAESVTLPLLIEALLRHRGYMLMAPLRAGGGRLWIGSPASEGATALDLPRVIEGSAETPAIVPPGGEPVAADPLDEIQETIARLGDAEAQPVLLHMLGHDPRADVRSAVFASLRERDALPTDAVLALALEDHLPALRRPALEVLIERRDTDAAAAAALSQLAAGDVDENVRLLAQQALEDRSKRRRR